MPGATRATLLPRRGRARGRRNRDPGGHTDGARPAPRRAFAAHALGGTGAHAQGQGLCLVSDNDAPAAGACGKASCLVETGHHIFLPRVASDSAGCPRHYSFAFAFGFREAAPHHPEPRGAAKLADAQVIRRAEAKRRRLVRCSLSSQRRRCTLFREGARNRRRRRAAETVQGGRARELPPFPCALLAHFALALLATCVAAHR
mmetsp:Transcript_7854/g.18546  ORF Transcript_7854/g.18546 Transcript_7854/m.18546 type:complete len:203 (+) Transcript_7854:639-1247(+)